MERDIRIDILKGIGIILVVWGHATAILIKEICIFHMPLFFFWPVCFIIPNKDLFNQEQTVAYSLWGIFSDIRCILF